MRHPTRRVSVIVVVALVGFVLAACGAVTTGEPTVGPVGAAPGDGSAGSTTAPCPSPAATQTGKVDKTVSVPPPGTFDPQGDERSYVLWVPPTYDGTTPLPLVVNYHGTGGDPTTNDAFSSDLSTKANARGYLVAGPQGLAGEATTERWVVPGFGTAPDDIAFSRVMLDQIAAEYCVDASRVYATGFSSGGAMATYLACEGRDRFAAAVPGGGVNLVDPSCNTGAIPMFAYHGTADDVAFFNGIDGNPTPPDPATAGVVPFFGSVEQVMDVWAQVNGCQVQRQDQNLAADAILRTYPGCAAPTQVLLAVGAGHTFPGGTTRLGQESTLLGQTITSVNMADLMLDWFDTRPAAPADASTPEGPA